MGHAARDRRCENFAMWVGIGNSDLLRLRNKSSNPEVLAEAPRSYTLGSEQAKGRKIQLRHQAAKSIRTCIEKSRIN